MSQVKGKMRCSSLLNRAMVPFAVSRSVSRAQAVDEDVRGRAPPRRQERTKGAKNFVVQIHSQSSSLKNPLALLAPSWRLGGSSPSDERRSNVDHALPFHDVLHVEPEAEEHLHAGAEHDHEELGGDLIADHAELLQSLALLDARLPERHGDDAEPDDQASRPE